MQGLAKYPVIFFSAYLATLIATPLVMMFCRKVGLLDFPGERRLHKTPVPRGGGIAVFLGFHFGCAAIFLLPWAAFEGYLSLDWWNFFLPISAIILLCGLIDDVRGLRPVVKLLAQIAVASLLFQADIRMGKLLGVELPFTVDYFFSVLWMVGITNAFNLIDGLDGLATGLALIASAGIGSTLLLRGLPGDALVFLALAGASAAFLRFNFSPAKIFLGDGGSMFLGMTIASCALETGSKGTAAAALGVPLLAVGVPIFDTLLAIWRRSMRKFLTADRSNITSADMEHLHHRLLSWGYSHRHVALVLYAASSVLVGVAVLSVVYHSHAVGIYLLAFAVGAYVIVRHVASVELWDSATVIVRGLTQLPTPVRTFVAYPIIDFLLLCFCLAAAILITSEVSDVSAFRQEWFRQIPLWCGLSFLALITSRTYSRVWSRSRVSDFGFLGIALFLSDLVALGVRLLSTSAAVRSEIAVASLYFGFSLALIAGIRALPRAVQDLRSLFGEPSSKTRERVLVYGANFSALLYLRHLMLSQEGSGFRVVGFVDDDRNLRNRIVYGYRVLGKGADIPYLLHAYNITRIVVTTSEASDEQLKAVPPRIGIYRWIAAEQEWMAALGMPRAYSTRERG